MIRGKRQHCWGSRHVQHQLYLLPFDRVKLVWNKVIRPGTLCWAWRCLASWAKHIRSGTGSTLQCSEHLCSVTCNTLPGNHCDLIRIQPQLALQPSEGSAWLLATAVSPGQPSVLDVKHCLPFMVPPGLYPSTFPITSSNNLIFLLRKTSVVIKLAFESWSSPGSNIIGLRMLCSTSREVPIHLHKVWLQVVVFTYVPKLPLPGLKNNKCFPFVQLRVNKSIVETFCVFLLGWWTNARLVILDSYLISGAPFYHVYPGCLVKNSWGKTGCREVIGNLATVWMNDGQMVVGEDIGSVYIPLI